MMTKERKICLPPYKLAYSAFFVAVLCVIRGVGSTYEIGVALEPPMALLAAVFCGDTYVQEIAAKRSEVERLYPMKNRMLSIFRRMVIQEFYLFLLATVGYGLFLIVQRPVLFYYDGALEWILFGSYLAAVAVTIIFFSMLSHMLSCCFRTMWAGIVVCLILWIFTGSKAGEQLLGKWNVFSYTFRNMEDMGDTGWLCGKLVCLVSCLLMIAIMPGIIRKRG